MYFVNRELLLERLRYMHKINEHMDVDQKKLSFIEQMAVERMVHLNIDIILDVGHQMIDAYMMKDPGNNEDIITVLKDEQVLPGQEAEQLIALVALRPDLVRDYTHSSVTKLRNVYAQARQALLAFPDRIHSYVEKHQDELTAFTNDTQKGREN